MIRHFLVSKRGTRSGTGKYKKPARGELAFIFLTAPTVEETDRLARDFKLDKTLLKDYTKIPYARRYSTKPFGFVMKDYFLENNQTESSNLLFIIEERYVILVSSKESRYYRKLFESSLDKISEVRTKSVGYILYNFLQEDVEDNYEVLEKTEEEISAIEKEVSDYQKEDKIDVDKIIKLKRRLFRIGRQFWASTKIITALRTGSAHVKLDDDSKLLLGDIYETFLHQIDVVSSQKDMLSDVLAIHSTNLSNRLASISNELNFVMKRLAAFALILMVPTLIASIYGMNFHYLPLADMRTGFEIMITSMVLSTLILVMLLRSRKWL
ncbi:hypothetical protein JXB11_01015 [Candidatus Woesearchaeota archaeon]|nr:hypothetical protein [Candidatus Woesearchaeota archaeon]